MSGAERMEGRYWPTYMQRDELLINPRLEWTKESAPCCQQKVDALFRPVIGLCGPDCVRRRNR
jgi:hypothetical protein